jgi:molecular chaperone DnaK (HSP70)
MPDRNTFICDVALNGKHVPYDLPQGTEIEVTLAIDESRTLKVEAYIPQIDLKLSVRSTEHDEKISVGNLQNSLTTEKKRYEKIKNLLTSDEKEHLDKTIAELEHSMDNL